jgi:hypothetical protein
MPIRHISTDRFKKSPPTETLFTAVAVDCFLTHHASKEQAEMGRYQV